MKISFKSSVGCDASKGCLGGFHLLTWALVEEVEQSRGAGACVCMSIHSGLRGEGDLQTQSHCQRDPLTPLLSFPDQEAAPQPHWQLEQHWAGAWLCVGTLAGVWEMGGGTSTAQGGCAATATIGHNNTGQHWRCHHPATPTCGKAIGHKELTEGAPWKDQKFCAVARKGAEHSAGSQEEEQSCEENIKGIKQMSCHWPKASSGEAAVTVGPSSAAWFPARQVFFLQGQETPGWEADGLGRPESCYRGLNFHIFYYFFSIFQHNCALLESILTSKKISVCVLITYVSLYI